MIDVATISTATPTKAEMNMWVLVLAKTQQDPSRPSIKTMQIAQIYNLYIININIIIYYLYIILRISTYHTDI